MASLTYLGEGRYDIDDILDRFKASAGEAADDPLRFALYNVELHGGQLDFTDQSVRKGHVLRDLQLLAGQALNLRGLNVALDPTIGPVRPDRQTRRVLPGGPRW